MLAESMCINRAGQLNNGLGSKEVTAISNIILPSPKLWGHHSLEATPDEIIKSLVTQTSREIQEFSVLPEGPEPCTDRDGYFRVSVIIPLTRTLFDQLMNGATGYRAHYSVSIEAGEDFNRRLVMAVAPIIVGLEQLYGDRFDRHLCTRSLLGPFSKFWYPKDLTDPSAQNELMKSKEELRIPRWVKYWSAMEKPRKGLLAPFPASMSVLLNGTFVDQSGETYEQKPNRSREIFDTGWT